VFLLSHEEDLVPLLRTDTAGKVVVGLDRKPAVDERVQGGFKIRRYAPRIRQSFERIELWTSIMDPGDAHWRKTGPNNQTTVFGGNSVPNRSVDTWEPSPARLLPPDNWKFSVIFDYGEHDPDNPKPADNGAWACRLDPFSNFRATFEVRTYRLCQRILMFHHFAELEVADYLVQSTNLTYEHNSTSTYLVGAIQSGYKLDETRSKYTKQLLPPIVFEYSRFPTDEELSRLAIQEVDKQSLQNAPMGLDGTTYQWVDLNSEGLSGILTEQGGALFYAPNSSVTNAEDKSGIVHARFDALELISTRPAASMTSGTTHSGDVASARLDYYRARGLGLLRTYG
jgi:Salmonella virulence plasmid 65kDa B protein